MNSCRALILVQVALLACASLYPLALSARIDVVLRKPQELKNGTNKETVIGVKTAHVVLADYDLLAHDFPELARRPDESPTGWKSRVDQWLVEHTSFVSQPQAHQTAVNSKIETSDQFSEAYRPPGYGRGLVFPVPGGLIDAKGVGSTRPAQAGHSNGLATLGECLREFLWEKAVSMIFRRAPLKANTVGTYAVIDFGFDVAQANGAKDRAGYVLRQAHRRADGFNSLLDEDHLLPIEKTLRRFGATSSGETMKGTVDFDYMNLQGTDNKDIDEVIDFGAFMAIEHFQRRLVSPRSQWTNKLMPGSPDFVQPDPMLRLPLEQWGDFGAHDPQADRPWVWSHELARAWAEGRADRAAVERHVENLLGPFRKKLDPDAPLACENLLRP